MNKQIFRSNNDPQTMSERKSGGFLCINCNYEVPFTNEMITNNRNHCPKCLYSKHLDDKVVGDRNSNCKSPMKPISLTFKKVKKDKYNNEKFGELMIVNECTGCQKLSINRIAADDNINKLEELLSKTLIINEEVKNRLEKNEIQIINEENKSQAEIQLFGKPKTN